MLNTYSGVISMAYSDIYPDHMISHSAGQV